jgi:hypothetical protein
MACLLFLLLVVGCAKQSGPIAGNDDAPVREAFSAFQAAIKAKDAPKVWGLLDSESQADADRAAKAVQAAYGKASPDEKAEQEKSLGLSDAELGALTGQGFLKTKRFLGKYDEVPESKIDKVTTQGDKATVTFIEPDGDTEKLNLVRQDGKWKLSVPMPK